MRFRSKHPIRIAITCDDAPSIAPVENTLELDPNRLDRVRSALKDARVSSCMAFVIGRHGRAHTGALERWLEAGYELGNHTDDHAAASRSSVARFRESIEACDALLEALGSFKNGRRRWFRFPYLDRGRDAGARRELAACYANAGYVLAPATVDLFDHPYELPLAVATTAKDRAAGERVCRRYVRAALASVERASARLELLGYPNAPLIAYLHAGEVSARALGEVLEALRRGGVEWCSLEEAVEHPIYSEYAADFERSGIVLGRHPSLLARGLGRLARASERWSLFGQARFGPVWPEL